MPLSSWDLFFCLLLWAVVTTGAAEEKRAGLSHDCCLCVSQDLASLLDSSFVVSFRRTLCAPELSLAELGVYPEGGIEDKSCS